jgi:gliding motility-associated-like protein
MATPVFSTHIVGGEITYRYLGNDDYEIRLSLFVDCVFGSPAAILQDSDAYIGVFDTANNLYASLLIPRNPPVRITSINYNCVLPPINACVDFYAYTDTIKLPYSPGGYTISFQRCCRNNSLVNIINPLSTGATYWTSISDTALKLNNSSPVFNSLPPNFLCTSFPFIFDHSATDPDGDSLVYTLFEPYSGANTGNPRPRPPADPPYSPVLWQIPYNLYNMMGGNPELSIDTFSGVLNVTPDIAGQFVVGIKVTEFRNGLEIGETKRDYQFNVTPCSLQIVSAFTLPLKYCSRNVDFQNFSSGATDYFWDFGIDSLLSDTSRLYTPSYLYPGAGSYEVTLIARKGNCADTFITTIEILQDTLYNAGADPTICFGDSASIGQADTSGRFTYLWTPSTGISDSLAPDPKASPDITTTYVVKKTFSICYLTDTITVFVKKPVAGFSPDYLPPCNSLDLAFTNNSQDATDYSWDFGVSGSLTDTSTFKDPAFTFPSPGAYPVKLVATDGNCRDTSDQQIRILDLAQLHDIPDTFSCNGDSVMLGMNDTSGIFTWLWKPDSGLSNTSIPNPVAAPSSTIRYFVSKSFDICLFTDSVLFTVKNVSAGFSPEYVPPCDLLHVSFINNSSGAKKYAWDFGVNPGVSDTSSLTNPDYSYGSPGNYIVRLLAFDGTCSDTFSRSLNVYIDTGNFAGADGFICTGDSLRLGKPDTTGLYFFSWSPATGLSNSKVADPMASPSNTTAYIVTRTSGGCQRQDNVTLNVSDPRANFEVTLTSECDSIYGDFSNNSTSAQRFLWDFGNNSYSTEHQPRKGFNFGQSYEITLVASDSFCTDTFMLSSTMPQMVNPGPLPNVFSPNGDGWNDCFEPYPIDCYELVIFNRWGQRVFEKTDKMKCWDGREMKTGAAMPEGVYYYLLKSSWGDFNGSLTLLR